MRVLMLAMLLAAVGCVASLPPVPQRDPVLVGAPFDRTWNAVIDVFAASNMPIATMERSSGFIATQPLRVGYGDGPAWATCLNTWRMEVPPQSATFNVVVREAGEDRTTVRVTVTYGHSSAPCVTHGTYEAQFERRVRERAETAPSGGASGDIRSGSRVIVQGAGARVRAAPNPNADIILTLPAADRFLVVDVADIVWARIDMGGGRSGYVHISELRPESGPRGR